jgi:hypothetical protein
MVPVACKTEREPTTKNSLPGGEAQAPPSLRGGEADEAIQGPRQTALDCFAALAMMKLKQLVVNVS